MVWAAAMVKISSRVPTPPGRATKMSLWASKAVAKIQEWNETKLHYEPVGEPVDMKQAITPEVKAQCEALGKAMAEKLLAE